MSRYKLRTINEIKPLILKKAKESNDGTVTNYWELEEEWKASTELIGGAFDVLINTGKIKFLGLNNDNKSYGSRYGLIGIPTNTRLLKLAVECILLKFYLIKNDMPRKHIDFNKAVEEIINLVNE